MTGACKAIKAEEHGRWHDRIMEYPTGSHCSTSVQLQTPVFQKPELPRNHKSASGTRDDPRLGGGFEGDFAASITVS